ncbi:hypothetical protein AUEXF2481DRAFT_608032 [Aureobasidium subglaciale EXF-2481]|uniref:Uncharacterized protein n=1 Tax=Aureobasidium subglaciale (strain EXF-2481) TaxID=1043005 RepID=A0A074YTM2_AURSE|nr:uncharacterized protein AUEXF2481DRAFT_608032 [Aureobasidium subglaciale EXF-2481]KEQ90161.1 hypothetical protein AUEXF2481DRAFT_608032 [Aureobasidium subglaciale EXF-2481]
MTLEDKSYPPWEEGTCGRGTVSGSLGTSNSAFAVRARFAQDSINLMTSTAIVFGCIAQALRSRPSYRHTTSTSLVFFLNFEQSDGPYNTLPGIQRLQHQLDSHYGQCINGLYCSNIMTVVWTDSCRAQPTKSRWRSVSEPKQLDHFVTSPCS